MYLIILDLAFLKCNIFSLNAKSAEFLLIIETILMFTKRFAQQKRMTKLCFCCLLFYVESPSPDGNGILFCFFIYKLL
ncbi:MAG TPA: hypothetical protein DD740_06580 [Chryseobacterium sp.]|nr:hypothetical protein [Chryseobacterium sp.]